MNRHTPGAIEVEGREFFYAEVTATEEFRKLTDAAMFSRGEVPLPNSGGVIEEKAWIILRDGRHLLCLSYKGDLSAWREILISHCKREGRRWGVVSNNRLLLSDGSDLALAECEVAFIDEPNRRS